MNRCMPVQGGSTAFGSSAHVVVCLIVRSSPGPVVAWLGAARSRVGAGLGAGLCQIWLPGVAPRIPLSCSSPALALQLRY